MRIFMQPNNLICAALAIALIAPTHLLAEQPTARMPQSVIVDAVLDSNGSITCQLLDRDGRPVANELVQVRQGRKLIARAKTDRSGNFRLVGFKGGLYRVQSNDTQRLYRFWTARTAPPAAKSNTVIVKRASVTKSLKTQPVTQTQTPVAPQEPVVRGQMGVNPLGLSGMVDGVSLVTLGSSIAAVALTAVTLNDINDVEDKVDRIPVSP